MPVYDYKYLVSDTLVVTTDAFGLYSLNTGETVPKLNKGGKFGLHVIVMTAFTGAASGVDFAVVISAADDIATSSIKHTVARVFIAALTKGAHIFIPLGSQPLLQYIGAAVLHVSEAVTAGAVTMYFGDAEPPS
jgi:hypothetical protein